jgi:cytochrome c biogenesis protein CcdA
MLLLIGFAFLAGVVTILSPCILPVLPIVLSGSVATGKRRPLGIVTGFILSFTFFTLFLSAIVKATGLSADALRTFAVVVIFLLGVSMLVPQFQVLLEKVFSKMTSFLPQSSHSTGFGGGLVTGITLGLIWTPCVGPILASVISLALTGSVNGGAVLITLAYALGTALPMLGILYGGRGLLHRVPWLLRNAGKLQKAFGVLMILTAIGIHFNIDRKFQTFLLETFPGYGAGLTQFEDNEAVREQLDALQDEEASGAEEEKEDGAPELVPGGDWLHTEPLTLESLRG